MATEKRSRGTALLTEPAIRSWLAKSEADALHDGRGLYLRRRGERAYWSLRQVNKVSGTRTWAALFPDIPYPKASTADARAAADAARKLAATQPTDLVRARIAQKTETRARADAEALAAQRMLTTRQLFTRWQTIELRPSVGADGKRIGRKDGGQYVLDQFVRRVFPVLGDVPAKKVLKGDLLAILDAVKAEGKLRTANVLLADLKQMFRFAAERDIVEHSPIELVQKKKIGGKNVERERVLTADEIRMLAEKLPAAKLEKRSEIALWLILSTGARIGELMRAEWSRIDLGSRRWHIPAEHSKNEREHHVHLSEFALVQLDALADLHRIEMAEIRERDRDANDVPWLFPNSKRTGLVCVKSLGKQLADRQRAPERRMAGRSKSTVSLVLANGRWTAHDLRRTAATVMAQRGVSSDVIDECLNHMIQSRMSRVYIRDRREAEQARAFDLLGDRLTEITTQQVRPTTVVAMHRAA